MPLFPPQDYRKTLYTHRRGLAAARPAAGDVLPGTLYYSTDSGIIERSNGTSWEAYSGAGGGTINNYLLAPPVYDGVDGEDAIFGPQGIPGPAGNTGAAGAPGRDGTIGLDGIDGQDGLDSLIPGPVGPSGSQGPQGATGATGPIGPPGVDADEPEIPLPIPGPAGPQGPQGTAGINGIIGANGLDGLDGEPGLDSLIPGPRGLTGNTGSQGIQGVPGPPGLDADEPEVPYIIPGPTGPQGPAGGGGGSAITVEVNLGATATWRGRFTITNASIASTSKIMIWQAPGPYTGKGTRADEAEMQPVRIIATNPATGSATVYWETPPMITRYMEPISQFLTAGTTVLNSPKDPQGNSRGYARRIGKVRGNVKFSYVIFS